LPPLAHDRTELPGPGPEERQHRRVQRGTDPLCQDSCRMI